MISRSLLSAFAVVVLAGCGGQSSSTETPADHPAHPTAAEAPAPERSRALRDQGTAPSETAQKNTAPVVYTCPHHPEVTSDKPGVCPKCEMKLQPKKADAGNAPPAGSSHDGHGGSHEGHGGHGGH